MESTTDDNIAGQRIVDVREMTKQELCCGEEIPPFTAGEEVT